VEQNEYEEGNNLKPDILMTQANNKYKSLVQANTWNATSLELQQIMALEATIKQLKKKEKPYNVNKGKGNNGKGKNKKYKKGTKKTSTHPGCTRNLPRRTGTNPRPTTRRSGGGALTTRSTVTTITQTARVPIPRKIPIAMPTSMAPRNPSKDSSSPIYPSSRQ